MEKMILGEKIIKSFGEGAEKRNVLQEVSIDMQNDEFVAIMGPSGSGKTTLMFALSGMDQINSGHVYFNGKELKKMREEELADVRRTEMGFIFQQPTMLKNLNILDNIILPAVRNNRKQQDEIVEQATLLMDKLGIAHLATRDTTQVSGGQLQRAGICRALINQPMIIFGDEPTGALNSKTADEVMDILSEINGEGTAIMLVTHDAKVAARAERIIFIQDGELVSESQFPKFNGENVDERVEQITWKMLEIGI